VLLCHDEAGVQIFPYQTLPFEPEEQSSQRRRPLPLPDRKAKARTSENVTYVPPEHVIVLCEVPEIGPKIQWTGFHEKA
jgi:hypothetical protein